jgi:bacterioferritin (cytochrome b1)
MGRRLLPRNLPELYAYTIDIERDAADALEKIERFVRDAGADHLAEELEKIVREEREQHQLICLGTAGRELPRMLGWEYMGHFMGTAVPKPNAPRHTRDALHQALGIERRTQAFYIDVAENSPDESVRAFAAEMAADEQRHIARLETLLAREPDPALIPQDEQEPKVLG